MSYEPVEFDMITFMDLSKCKELLDLGVNEKQEYMVSYVFNNDDFVIVSETFDGIKFEEFLIKKEHSKYAWFLYSILPEEQIMKAFEYENLFEVSSNIMESDNSEFKVGEFLKFENLKSSNSINKNQISEEEFYEILRLLPFNGVVIKVKEKELSIHSNAYCDLLKFSKKVEFHDILIENVDNFLQNMLELNKERLIEVSIDKCLKSGNYEKIKQIKGMVI